jgi:hypothetical protein
MVNTAAPAAIVSTNMSEVLEVALSILERASDEHLARKALIMQGFLEMSQRYPERDYRATLNRALADLTDAVSQHLSGD